MKKTKARLISFFWQCFFLLFQFNFIFVGKALAGSDTGGGATNGEVKVPDEVVITLTKLTSILLLIGSAICIGKLIQIGIMYLTSSVAEKSFAKQAVLPWIIGTIVCFGAATIGNAVIKIFLNAMPSGSVLDY